MTVGADGTMVDFAGGDPSSQEAAVVALQAALATDEILFYRGMQYRRVLVAPADRPTRRASHRTTSPTSPRCGRAGRRPRN